MGAAQDGEALSFASGAARGFDASREKRVHSG
jgi:hypothetical protein